MPEMQQLLLPVPESAKALHISERALWKQTNEVEESKRIPCVKIGRSVRYRPEDLAAWVAANSMAVATK
jgi:predicted DNA-binding transcriptional regulator AlpA